MESPINPDYPDIEFLRQRAKARIPRFVFEYLDGGCNSEVNLRRNTAEIRDVQLKPYYLRDFKGADLKTELFGKVYDAPFGIAPIGLQGLIWPKASEILAKAAFKNNIPFILSTVGTSSIETIGELTEGNAWFQLYHPVKEEHRNKLIERTASAGYQVLVILADVPVFGYRGKEIRNGLSIPPRISVRNLFQILGRPAWALKTLFDQPRFATLDPYIPKGVNLTHLGSFMNEMFDGRLNEDRIKSIRDLWKGKLVLKGVASEEDTQKAIALGLDGVIVSNHGGRQLDHGESTIKPLQSISEKYGSKITVMMDSGIRTGPDIASSIACGANFTFLGRSFMYGVGALGERGGDHTISLLKTQLLQVMKQLGCETVEDLKGHLVG